MRAGFLVSIVVLLGLTSCGGGGGGGSTSSVSIPNITVATGAAVEGATVSVVDSTGASETCSGVTNTNGQISCTLTTATSPPYFIRAQKLTSSFYAVLPSTSTTVNITPVSTAMAKKFANDNGMEAEQIISQPSSMAGKTAASAQAAVDLVNAIIKVIALQTAGLTIDNALTQSYSATTSDKLDQFIHNMNISSDSSGINISIPTNAGTVSVNVAYTTTVTTATSNVTANTAGVTANMTDATSVDDVLSNFLTYLANCSASDKIAMRAMVHARTYSNGDQYSEGQTVGDWVNRICSQGLGTLRKTYTKNIAKYGNRNLSLVGIVTANGNEFETIFGFIKVNGAWKLQSDNLPVNHSFKTRHALAYEFDDSNMSAKFKYERYLDTWIDAERMVAAAAPAIIKLYAVPVKTAASKYNDASAFTGSSKLNPHLTLYKTSNCGTRQYILDATPNSTNCNSFAPDSDNVDLFSVLEGNDYTLLIIKTEDPSGNCLNCDGSGIPESGTVLGKAYAFTKLFGNTQSESSLKSGVNALDLDSTFENKARVYFSAPSKAQLISLANTFSGSSAGNSVSIPWTRATKDNQQINGLWAGYVPCGSNSSWVNFDEPNWSDLTATNSWTLTSPVPNKTLQNAGYLSFTLSNRVNETEFAFYINFSRRNTCTI